MGIRDLFKKDRDKRMDPLKDLSLSRLEVGYLVDFDLETWEVVAHHHYDWGEGDVTHEWQLRGSGGETVFLEREADDEEDWSLNRKIPFGRIGAEVKQHILEKGDPPEKIDFEGHTFYLDEMAGGHFFKDGKGPGKELLRWSYEDEEGRYLCIEQWGEEEFEATLGQKVEEYQFTNILPRETGS